MLLASGISCTVVHQQVYISIMGFVLRTLPGFSYYIALPLSCIPSDSIKEYGKIAIRYDSAASWKNINPSPFQMLVSCTLFCLAKINPQANLLLLHVLYRELAYSWLEMLYSSGRTGSLPDCANLHQDQSPKKKTSTKYHKVCNWMCYMYKAAEQ